MATKLIIIGGVAGGATAAARARRVSEHAEIILFERGDQISFANCGLPYYIGGIIEDRTSLVVTTREAFMKRYRIDVRIGSQVLAIDRPGRQVMVRDILSGVEYRESYEKIILAPGAEPIKPPLPGIDLGGIFHLRDIPDSDRIKMRIDVKKPEKAIVVGGGFIGLEMAENLVHRGIKTTIVEMGDQVMAPLDPEMAGIIHGHLRDKGVILELGQRVESFAKMKGGIGIATAQGKEFVGDLIISALGVKPENNLAKDAGLLLGPRGHIKVDACLQTSDPDIFAVGDAVEIEDVVTGRPTSVALAGPANKQGRIAADNAMGRKSLYKGGLGTSIVKVFDLTIGGTGPNERQLLKHGIPFRVSYTHSGSHASYYPGSSPIAIKLLFAPGNGKILGAQIIGCSGVDKRIDVLATAIHGSMTVFDLEELELAYAPPYSSAKDPVNIAGFAASNILKADSEVVLWNELASLRTEGAVFLDLRSAKEIEAAGKISESVHIPLDELRDSLEILDKAKLYVPYCAVGMRGYVAHRILVQHGFRSKNLAGGYRTFLGAKEEIMRESPEDSLWLSE